MGFDQTLPMREAIVELLSSSPAITVTVYGPEVPDNVAFPFIRYGLPITTQYEATRRQGSEHAITIHVFANGPGEDDCANIAAAVVETLDDASINVDTLGNYGIDWTGTQIIRDGPEASAYHGIVTFTARTFAPDTVD